MTIQDQPQCSVTRNLEASFLQQWRKVAIARTKFQNSPPLDALDTRKDAIVQDIPFECAAMMPGDTVPLLGDAVVSGRNTLCVLYVSSPQKQNRAHRIIQPVADMQHNIRQAGAHIYLAAGSIQQSSPWTGNAQIRTNGLQTLDNIMLIAYI